MRVSLSDSSYNVTVEYFNQITSDTTYQIEQLGDFCQTGEIQPAFYLYVAHNKSVARYKSVSGFVTFDLGADTTKVTLSNAQFLDDDSVAVTLSGKFYCAD